MGRVLSVIVIVFGLAFAVQAQDKNESLCKLPASIEQLKEKATEVADINMDPNMLKLAASAMNKGKANEEEIKKMISGVRNICVRSYKFDQPMQFSDKDMDLLRSQFGDSSWAKMVNVRNQKTGENVDVLYQMKDGLFAGFAVIVAQPLEFTLVRIDGEIDLSQLAKLGGSLGLPKLNMPGQSNPEQKK